MALRQIPAQLVAAWRASDRVVDLHAFVDATWPCSGLVDHGFTEDGDPVILPCDAPAYEVGAGWRCIAGHEHLGIEVEWAPFGPEWQRDQAERYGR